MSDIKVTMPKKYWDVLMEMLEELSDRYGNDGCNDWKFPDDWTDEEVDEFGKLFSKANRPSDPNGDGEDYSYLTNQRMFFNNGVLAVISYKMKEQIESQSNISENN